MKKAMKITMILLGMIILSLTVISQKSPVSGSNEKSKQITPSISVGEKETCKSEFYDATEPVYGYCTFYSNITSCSNSTGPNTDCSTKHSTFLIPCKTGEKTLTKNRTQCKPDDKFIISIDNGVAVAKNQLDFSQFGPCIYEEKNDCLLITCVANEDGAFKGQFTDCKSGKSCQRFEVCDSHTTVSQKNSRDDFVTDDPTFNLPKLKFLEVGK